MLTQSQKTKELDFILIKKAAKGSEKAFSDLINLHQVRIRQSIFHFGANQDECDEIFQKALIKIWKNVKNFKFQSSFYTWYYRICYNLFVDEKRKTARDKALSLDSLIIQRGDTREHSDDRQLDIILNRILTENPEKNQSPLEKLNNKEDEKEQKKAVSFILQRLSPKHEEVLRMFELEDLSYSDIAKRIKCSVGTVMSRLFYARENAKRIIKRYKSK